jgi:aspartyl-tRNA(Asn)/glutamyl-tRNA(Gln) amidotransferase subunit A
VTLREAALALNERQVSSAELTQSLINRVDNLNLSLQAFLTVLPQAAMDRSRLADQERKENRNRGPLHGIAIGVKDAFDVRGVRTTAGSKVIEYVPTEDAAVVQALEAAGAVILGKLNQHELSYGITSNNPHFGAVRNPWDTERIPGGSSGGSAVAVAADLVFAALGTDTGGSVRIPASYCGVVGLKPTFGRISRVGLVPLAPSLDHVGVLARNVRDTATVFKALVSYDPRDPGSSRHPVVDYSPQDNISLQGLRVGFPEKFFFDRLDPDVESAVRGAIARAEALGADVRRITLPDMDAINACGYIILLAEAAAIMEPYAEERSRIGGDVLRLLDQGRCLPAVDYVNAQRLRRKLQLEFAKVWQEVDCLITPTTPNVAPRIGEELVRLRDSEQDVRAVATRLVRPFNVLGLPALSMPCGLGGQGLPIGLQLVAPPFEEATLLQLGAMLEDGGIGIPPSFAQNLLWK